MQTGTKSLRLLFFFKIIFVFKSGSYLRILVTSPGSCPEYEMKTCVQVWLTHVELGASLLIQLENTQQFIFKLHLHFKMADYVTLSDIKKDQGGGISAGSTILFPSGFYLLQVKLGPGYTLLSACFHFPCLPEGCLSPKRWHSSEGHSLEGDELPPDQCSCQTD